MPVSVGVALAVAAGHRAAQAPVQALIWVPWVSFVNAYRTFPLPSTTMSPSELVAVLSSVTALAVLAGVLDAVLGALVAELVAAGGAAGVAVEEHAVTRARVAAVANVARS
jgi:hypothetical protein